MKKTIDSLLQQDLHSILAQATELPKLSFAIHDECIETDPLDILHRRFDALSEKLEQFQNKITELPFRPANLIPITGTVSGLVKYCRHLKERRENQDNINYVCYLYAYNYVYDHLTTISKLAAQLQQTLLTPPTLTNTVNIITAQLPEVVK